MKATKGSRIQGFDHAGDDVIKKAVKLAPIKKSGKERHMIYSSLEDEDEDPELMAYAKRESVLDYFDDEEEEI
ncbi:MAG: hypothetical protein LUF87_05775 [Alistipes sp.]|nr:hypothetical protein [Alistipes sp.]